MDTSTFAALFTFVSGLSVATERITEVLKGVPGVSQLLAVDKTGAYEEARQAAVQFLAMIIGAILAASTLDVLPAALSQSTSFKEHRVALSIVFGVLASGGSGLWNSALDIVRETNKQKQILTDRLKAN